MAIACGSRAHLEKESIAQVRLSSTMDQQVFPFLHIHWHEILGTLKYYMLSFIKIKKFLSYSS